MKTFFLILLVLLGLRSDSAFACRTIEQRFQSTILSSDRGETYVERYLAIVPDNYDPKLHYGAVYFLHGRDNDRSMIQQLGMCQQIDRLVAENKNPFVVIAPDGQNSYWMNAALPNINGAKPERWADMVTQELIADAESKYSLIHEASARVIAGISMGGHGAIQLSLNFPGVFGAIGAHSPVFRSQAEAAKDFYHQFGVGKDYENHDPFSLMQLQGKQLKAALYLDMGGKDAWLKNTKRFSEYLTQTNFAFVNQVATDPDYGHQGIYWEIHLTDYTNWYSEHLPKPAL